MVALAGTPLHELGLLHSIHEPGAVRAGDEECVGEVAHRSFAAPFGELDENVVPLEGEVVFVAKLPIEFFDDSRVGLEPATPDGKGVIGRTGCGHGPIVPILAIGNKLHLQLVRMNVVANAITPDPIQVRTP